MASVYEIDLLEVGGMVSVYGLYVENFHTTNAGFWRNVDEYAISLHHSATVCRSFGGVYVLENNDQLQTTDPWFAVPVSVLKDSNLATNEKLVYIVLLSYAGRNSVAWPKIKKIAAEAGMSETTAKRSLAKLESAKYLERKERFERTDGGKVRQTSNMYTIYTPAQAAERRGEMVQAGGVQPERGVQSDPQGGFNLTDQELDHLELDQEKQISKNTHKRKESGEGSDAGASVPSDKCKESGEGSDAGASVPLGENTLHELCSLFSRVTGDAKNMDSEAKLLDSLSKQYGVDFVKEKVQLLEGMQVRNPAAALKIACREDWKKPTRSIPAPTKAEAALHDPRYQAFYDLYPDMQ